MELTLVEISKLFPKSLHIFEDKPISLIDTDPEKAITNSVIVLIWNDDPEKAAKTAIDKGAQAIIAFEPVGEYPCIIAEPGVNPLQTIASYYVKKRRLKTIGIAGSIGKTTVKDMTRLVLSQTRSYERAAFTAAPKSSFNETCLDIINTDRTVPCAVAEISSKNKGETADVSKTITPTISVITNVGATGVSGDTTNEIMGVCAGMNGDGYLVLNIDDPVLKTIKDVRPTVITVSALNKNADFFADDIQVGDDFLTFELVNNAFTIHVKLNGIGRYNIINALQAFAVGYILGGSPSLLAAALGDYKPSGADGNILKFGSNTVIADCDKATPDTVAAGISLLMDMQVKKGGKRIVVLGSLSDEHEMNIVSYRSIGRQISATGIQQVIVCGTMAGYIADEMKASMTPCLFFSNTSSLSDYLKNNVKENDIVLMAADSSSDFGPIVEKVFESGEIANTRLNYSRLIFPDNKSGSIDVFTRSVVVTDMRTGKIICGKNIHSRHNTASMTRLAVAAMILDSFNPEAVITVSGDIEGCSYAKGEKLTIRDIVFAYLVGRTQDEGILLADFVAGGVEPFVERLNEYIAKIGTTESHFDSLTGAVSRDNYTSVRDLTVILNHAMKNDVFRMAFGCPAYTIQPTNMSADERKFVSLNKMFFPANPQYYKRLTGGRVGNVKDEYVMAAVAGNYSCVMLSAPVINKKVTVYDDAKALFDYCFTNFGEGTQLMI